MRLASILLFLLGAWVSIRAISAAYRVIDLWYTIRTAYPAVLRGVSFWGAAIVVPLVALGEEYRGPFLAGLLGFSAFYLALFPLRYLILRQRS